MTSAVPVRHEVPVETLPMSHENMAAQKPSVDRVVSLMPGFVYVFNHTTYSNDYANRSIGEHLGYSAEEIQAFGAQMLMEVVNPDDHPLLGAHMERIAALKDDSAVALEYRVITKSGAQRWLRSVDTVFERAADGKVLRHIGCASDITIEKEAETRLSQANAVLEEKVAARTHDIAALNSGLEAAIRERTSELQDAVDQLEQLAYVATHDLKVPLNNLNRLGLMLSESLTGLSIEQREQVGWINDCITQLNDKVHGLVLVSQIRTGKGPPCAMCGLRDMVLEAVAAFEGADATFSIDVADDVYVQCARPEVIKILTWLLDNAVQYAVAGRCVQITINAGIQNDQVWVSVGDNGSGFDMEQDLGKVFGLFQRAHKDPKGSGLSLYCAQQILHRDGGQITAHGRQGEGAEFTIFFPTKEASQ